MKRRVVITGMGAVTPIGNTLDEFWNGIKEEKVGIGAITKFDTEDYKVKIAAEVKDFNVKERLDNKVGGGCSKRRSCEGGGGEGKRGSGPCRCYHWFRYRRSFQHGERA